MFVITHRNIFLGLSAFFVVASIVAMLFFGLRFGIDFTGGSILEVAYSENRPTIEEVNTALTEAQFTGFVTQSTGERGVIVRTITPRSPVLCVTKPVNCASVRAVLTSSIVGLFSEYATSKIEPPVKSIPNRRPKKSIATIDATTKNAESPKNILR